MQFTNLANFRDLGGIPAAGGKHLKYKRLLRSGELYGLSQAERDALVGEYHLKTVVDFRTPEERKSHPDAELPGVQNIGIDIMEAPEKAASLENFLAISSGEKAVAFMRRIYGEMASDAGAQRGYAKFLRLAAGQKEGALLFHCFAGKDRAGMGAALLLTLLGASRDDIMADYLKTNELRKEANETIMERLKHTVKTPGQVDALQNLLEVRAEYLDRAFEVAGQEYGTFEGYIRQAMGITDADIAALRGNYLE